MQNKPPTKQKRYVNMNIAIRPDARDGILLYAEEYDVTIAEAVRMIINAGLEKLGERHRNGAAI